MQEQKHKEEEFDFKMIFVPFTTTKAIHWIIIIGLVVFANMLFNGFVWDDNSYIIYNPDFQHLNFFGLITNNVFNSTAQYRPIPAIYFSLLFHTFYQTAFFYHLIQIFLHITSASLLFIFFTKFFSKKISFFLALVFLIHPMQVESVSFIGAAGNILFFLFGMVALLISWNFKEDAKRLFCLFFFLLLSFLSKETGFLFLFVIWLGAFLYKRHNVRVFVVGGIITTIVYFLIRFGIGHVYFGKSRFVPIGDLNFSQRIINIPAVIFYYIKTFFFPRDLAIDQQWIVKNIDYQHFYFPLGMDALFFLLLVGIGIYLFIHNKKYFKVFLFFFLWTLVGFFMHSQIISLDMTVADRWFYFILAGFLGIAGVVLNVIHNKINNKLLWILGGIILILLAGRTIIRNMDWKDDITLNTHDIAISTNAFGLENNLSYAYIKVDRCKDAQIYAEKSIAIYPTFDNYINLGVSSFCLKNYALAKNAYLQALRIENVNSAYEHLANLALVYGDPENNIHFLNTNAVKKFPTDTILWRDLALLEYKHGDKHAAISDIKQAFNYGHDQSIYYVYTLMNNNKSLGKINIQFGE